MDFKELLRILLTDKPSKELEERKDDLAILIPEFLKTYDFDQKTIWHHLDVFQHTLSVVDEVEPDKRVRLAALFHDVGKPDAMTIDGEGQGHFFGHWEISEEIFKKYQNQFGLSEEDIYLIRKLIFYHDLTIKEDSIPIFMEQFSEKDMDLLFSLKRADAVSHNPDFVKDRLIALKQARKDYHSVVGKLGVTGINQQIRTMKKGKHSVKQISDTNHTFEELYEERALLLAAFCNDAKCFTFKSKKHFDEENDPMFEGDFIVGIHTPEGMVTYHIPLRYWDLFDITELERGCEYDGSTPEQNREKLKSLFGKNKN